MWSTWHGIRSVSGVSVKESEVSPKVCYACQTHAGEGLPRLQPVGCFLPAVGPWRGIHSHLMVRGATNKRGREQGPRAPSGVTQTWMLKRIQRHWQGWSLETSLSLQDWSLPSCDTGHSIRCEFWGGHAPPASLHMAFHLLPSFCLLRDLNSHAKFSSRRSCSVCLHRWGWMVASCLNHHQNPTSWSEICWPLSVWVSSPFWPLRLDSRLRGWEVLCESSSQNSQGRGRGWRLISSAAL